MRGNATGTDAEGTFAPTQVSIIDVAEEMPLLTRDRPDGRAYRGAWVLVLDHGAPIRIAEFPFVDASIGGEPLRRLLVGDAVVPDRPVGSDPVSDRVLPSISVVVPTTFERFDQLERCAHRLSSFDYPDYEAIIVDNRPNRPGGDQERQRIGELPHVRVVTESVRGTSAAKNRGIAAASGEVVAFTDDDARPHPGWLRAIGTRFATDTEVTCVTGPVVPAELETVTQQWFEQGGYGPVVGLHSYRYRSAAEGPAAPALGRDRFMARRIEESGTAEHWLYQVGRYGQGNNYSFRREYLQRVGGFDLSLGPGTPTNGGEDVLAFIELLSRGGVIGYEPSAIVSHTNRRTYDELRAQIFNYGLGFTAALTAVAWRDPRHLIGYARMSGQAIRSLRHFGTPTEGRAATPPDFPEEFPRVNLLGMLAGPFAYGWSRWKYRDARSAVTERLTESTGIQQTRSVTGTGGWSRTPCGCRPGPR